MKPYFSFHSQPQIFKYCEYLNIMLRQSMTGKGIGGNGGWDECNLDSFDIVQKNMKNVVLAKNILGKTRITYNDNL